MMTDEEDTSLIYLLTKVGNNKQSVEDIMEGNWKQEKTIKDFFKPMDKKQTENKSDAKDL